LNDSASEKTEVYYGTEDAVGKGAEFMASVKDRMNLCYDQNAPSIVVEVETYRKGYIDILKRGGRIRVITEITTDNLHYCKQLMHLVTELRHLDFVKGGLAVSECAYMATAAALEQGKPLTQVIYSNVKVLVEQNQYLFDTLWNKAIPATQRIDEIEKGVEATRIEIISDPKESIEHAIKIMKRAEDEVLVIFATSHIFEIALKLDSSDIYNQVLRKNERVKIRLLTPGGGERTDALAKRIVSSSEIPRIQVRISERDLQTRITIMIIDRKEVMVWQVRDDNSEAPLEAAGVSTYSNSSSIASSYAAIFESLWKQTEMYEKLKDRDQLQQQFINIAAHELRTPVQPIIMNSEALKRKSPDDERIRIISRNATKLQKLTENLLDLTRIESKTLKLNKELFNLNDKIKDAIDDVIHTKATLGGNGIRQAEPQPNTASTPLQIIFEPTEDPLIIDADMVRISQVVSNLLNNAITHTSRDIILVSTKNEGLEKHVVVSVKDRGIGIAQGVFSLLFTKHPAKSSKGFGLGLYISKSIVEAHDGRIWAENNKDGKGATFSFSLPLASFTPDAVK
jgi:two-component system sensor histidine kinase VicK